MTKNAAWQSVKVKCKFKPQKESCLVLGRRHLLASFMSRKWSRKALGRSVREGCLLPFDTLLVWSLRWVPKHLELVRKVAHRCLLRSRAFHYLLLSSRSGGFFLVITNCPGGFFSELPVVLKRTPLESVRGTFQKLEINYRAELSRIVFKLCWFLKSLKNNEVMKLLPA